MNSQDSLQTVRAELEAGIALKKCQKCGCMEGTLKGLAGVLPSIGTDNALSLATHVSASLKNMLSIQYACLGCEYCYPAVAQNAFGLAFPALSQEIEGLSCDFRVREASWPPVAGEYFVLDTNAPVAVSTLANVSLAAELARRRPNRLAIVGKTETENIGIDKIIRNIVASSTIRYLVVAGADARGHHAGRTLLALAANGIDEDGRVIGSPGKRPVLRNVSAREVTAFRKQVQVIDMLECENSDEVCAQIEKLSLQDAAPCGCHECGGQSPISISASPRVTASKSSDVVKLDRAGYFVIVPLRDKGLINVEHYDYNNLLLRVVEGEDAQTIYKTIITNSWVTELSHAAYLGKELAKAELSQKHGFKYVQDGA